MNQLQQQPDNSGFVKAVQDEDYISLVKSKALLEVTGVEGMTLTESFSAFFKEFSTSIDRKMSGMSGSVHTVDVNSLRRFVENSGVQFVRNTGVEIIVPANFTPGLANMMQTVNGIVNGVIILNSLKIEGARLYDWLKQVVKTGRAPTRFSWTVTNFDAAIDQSLHFIRNLPDEKRRLKCPLGQVYVNFQEMIDVVERFNSAVKTIGARETEVAHKEMANAYSMGQILIQKIKSNDVVLDKNTLTDIECMINAFIELTNLAGALMTVTNEMSAVLREQIKEVISLH